MKIDLNDGPQALPETDRKKLERRADISSASRALAGEGSAELSGAPAQVQALAAQAAQLPEVRQERVYSLRKRIQSGLYRPGADMVAGAMFEHMIAAPRRHAASRGE